MRDRVVDNSDDGDGKQPKLEADQRDVFSSGIVETRTLRCEHDPMRTAKGGTLRFPGKVEGLNTLAIESGGVLIRKCDDADAWLERNRINVSLQCNHHVAIPIQRSLCVLQLPASGDTGWTYNLVRLDQTSN